MCLVAEVNACHSQARGKCEQTTPQLELSWRLAQELLHNTLDVPQALPPAAVAPRRRSNTVHALTKRERKGVKWNPSTRCFQRVETIYTEEQQSTTIGETVARHGLFFCGRGGRVFWVTVIRGLRRPFA